MAKNTLAGRIGCAAIVGAMAAALPSLAGCIHVGSWGGGPTSTRSATQTAPAAKSLQADLKNGAIEVVRDAAATGVTIDCKFRCEGATDDEAAARVAAAKLVTTVDASGTLHVSADFPPAADGRTFSQDGVSITIHAPSFDGFDLHTTNGHIEIGGFQGSAKLRSTNGHIIAKDHKGAVDAQTSNGAITCTSVGAPLKLQSSNGAITVSLASGATGAVDVRTSNGAVTLELPSSWQGSVVANTSNGKVTMEGGGRAKDVTTTRQTGAMTLGNAGGATATVTTSNGAVTVKAAE